MKILQKTSNYFHNSDTPDDILIPIISYQSKKKISQEFQSSSLSVLTSKFLTKYSNSSSVRLPS